MRYCDNISAAHEPQVIHDTDDAMVAVCKNCKKQQVFRKDKDGRMDNRAYLKFFKRDVLQPTVPLYYKYHSDKMNIL